MEHWESRIRSAGTENRKRKYPKEYKHHKGEWIELEKEIAKRRNVLVNKTRFEDDESFMNVDNEDDISM
jgi:hypothetical protein